MFVLTADFHPLVFLFRQQHEGCFIIFKRRLEKNETKTALFPYRVWAQLFELISREIVVMLSTTRNCLFAVEQLTRGIKMNKDSTGMWNSKQVNRHWNLSRFKATF